MFSLIAACTGGLSALCVCCAGLTTGDAGWGSPTFAKMGRKKIRLISLFLKLDVQVGTPAEASLCILALLIYQQMQPGSYFCICCKLPSKSLDTMALQFNTCAPTHCFCAILYHLGHCRYCHTAGASCFR